MQKFTNSIKRPNLRIISIEEGEEVQAKGIHNIFNKIITENFPNPPGH
jgi:archaeosine-15-forming tRNA-guanine transglycosylase